ncbi:HNH endonuclease signature motif containing protein [Nocardioides sp. GY 10127]|uniref:HNH endonuclease signature motif containing protein n=1 Tax=Nocardioides sp. GY 10127 TaxID=2569762 RepID=UPI0010A8219E|nr:HNH endonuclease signature motif containing protein [Nocardioides sp. GY 10127]TIC84245.1 HNH endonuclease [Nocardioides sp. GY 10127]
MQTTRRHPTTGLLARLDDARRAAAVAEVEIVLATLEWAHAHPEESLGDPRHAAVSGTSGPSAGYAADSPAYLHGDRALELGGPGCPAVTEAAVVEWAAALGTTTEAGRRFVGDVLETHHRLPRAWAALTQAADPEQGDTAVPWWKVRRLAQATKHLPLAGAAFVDAQVAAVGGRVGPAQLDRLVAEALVRFDPETAEEQALAAAEDRHVTIGAQSGAGLRMVDHTGTAVVEAVLDATDAADLEAAVSTVAAELAALGSRESLPARRAAALGEIARRQLQGAGEPRTRRDLTVYVHVSEDAVRAAADPTTDPTTDVSDHPVGEPTENPLVRVESTPGTLTSLGGGFTTLEVLARWVTESVADTRITVRPVIDQRVERHTEAYEFPDRLAEQVRLREATCVFPHCRRAARRCDTDHVVPHARGGPTSTDNAAPLCRTHHRAKTHLGWAYHRAPEGPAEQGRPDWLWTSPHGRTYLRTPQGTRSAGG